MSVQKQKYCTISKLKTQVFSGNHTNKQRVDEEEN